MNTVKIAEGYPGGETERGIAPVGRVDSLERRWFGAPPVRALLATTALGALLAAGIPAPGHSQTCAPRGGACIIQSNGTNGNDGHDGQGDNPGQGGTMGTPSGDISTDLDDLLNLTSDGAFSPMDITSIGGGGGNGGDAGNTPPLYLDRNQGGSGMPGSDAGTITKATFGDNGIGILAQSVAGGGGLALGGKPDGDNAIDFIGGGGKEGSVNQGLSLLPDDNMGVTVQVGADINTYGQGGVGVFAQSVGGGGGISGDIGWSMQTLNMGSYFDYVGDGGDVSVTVDQDVAITTTGNDTPGIIAQSVGGGGGWITNKNGAYVGSAGGTGTAGFISVTVNGVVDAQGQGSPGIFVQSAGGASNHGSGEGDAAYIYVGSETNSDATVFGGSYFGDAAAAIFIDEGTSDNGTVSVLENYGIINTNDQQNGTAIYSAAADFLGENYNSITGNLHIAHGGVTNYGSGTVHPFSAIDLSGGDFVNRGTVDLTGEARVTRLTGDYVGGSRSRLVFGADFLKETSDQLAVSGDAILTGGIVTRSSTLVPGMVTVLTAGDLDPGDGLSDATGAHRFDFTPAVAGDRVTVTPSADFRVDGIRGDRASLAGHLRRIWDGGRPRALAHGFADLSTIGDAQGYAAVLDGLISRQVGAVATARASVPPSSAATTGPLNRASAAPTPRPAPSPRPSTIPARSGRSAPASR